MIAKLKKFFLEMDMEERLAIATLTTVVGFFILVVFVFFTWVTGGWALTVFVPGFIIGYFMLNLALSDE